jgi:hypothetical protein
MTLPITPDVDAVMTKLRALVLDVLPAGIECIQGPINRAAQPKGPHVVITILFDGRLRMNVTRYTRPVDPPPAAGTADIEQGTELHVQLDYYGGVGASMSAPNQWAIAFQTAFNDEYAVDMLAPEAAPLYIDDARMIPLVTGEEQYLSRWASTARLQYNPVTTKPQQFAEQLDVVLIDAENLE